MLNFGKSCSCILTTAQLVVEERSACLPLAGRISLSANHKELNKFTNRHGSYDVIKGCIRRIYDRLEEGSLFDAAEAQYIIMCSVDVSEGATWAISDHWPISKDGNRWERAKDRWCLCMGGSGTSGTLVLTNDRGESFGVTLGIHNYLPWTSISVDITGENAQDIRDSFYRGKRENTSDHWDQRTEVRRQRKDAQIAVKLEKVDSEGRTDSEHFRAVISIHTMA
jgi:hypothetical protein